MAVLIKDDETDRLVRALAARTGETITLAVRNAVAERLDRMPLPARAVADRKRRLRDVIAKSDAMPTVDNRTPDEIVGYNERGHFD
ncbi:MAG: PSK operon transcription factor [Alphaproteobacteria bacterium]|nr:PSK operon transcription factor [Alphaproteobacteria bacterium]